MFFAAISVSSLTSLARLAGEFFVAPTGEEVAV